MKIALLGYGKMGKAVEQVAVERGHEMVAAIDNGAEWDARRADLGRCDVAIDFSMPSTAVENIHKCFDLNLPVVVGTTGWYDRLDEMVAECQKRNQALFVASNFSIGMNIMFDLNRRLAQLMNGRTEYSVSIAETHHVHKLDAPSGTAITLANDTIDRLEHKSRWIQNGELWIGADNQVDRQKSVQPTDRSTLPADTIPVLSVRQAEEPGTHTVVYDGPVDTIFLSHRAKSRQGLALGAVLAAEFLHGRHGYFTMADLLG